MTSSSSIKRITVEIRRTPGESRLVISADGASDSLKSRPMQKDDLDALRKRLTSWMHKLYNLWWQRQDQDNEKLLNEDFDKIKESLKELYKYSMLFLRLLFGPRGPEEVTNYFSQNREGGLASSQRWERPCGMIQFEANVNLFVPIEYLFLPFRGYNYSPNNFTELLSSLTNILGFSYLIRRSPPIDDESSSFYPPREQSFVVNKSGVEYIDYTDRLNTDIFPYYGLAHVQDEVAFFRDENDHVFSVHMIPASGSNYTASKIINRMLERKDVHLHHFCCHCDTTNHGVLTHILRLGDHKMKSDVTLEEMISSYPLDSDLVEMNQAVFLNACDSASSQPLRMVSFPWYFQEYFGHIAFIGPDSRIPDSFAYEFARVFYFFWLELRDLGYALFKTRWFFARYHNSPMGLLYTFYANGDVRLRGPEKRVHITASK